MYASAFRRLAGVTQVASPLEGHVVHNRLTHTLEAAQIARRLAEKLKNEDQSNEVINGLGGIDPDVVEAATLAHDLGHPPFGHIAEKELDRLATANGAADGFEGNAQSFRIVVRLAAHRRDYAGLDLTRATLDAILKYPWMRDIDLEASKEHKKYGAYFSDAEDFRFAREQSEGKKRSLEASIMDISDAIAYSVHDLDDFVRVGLVPIEGLIQDTELRAEFIAMWAASVPDVRNLIDAEGGAIDEVLDLWPVAGRYSGTYGDRAAMRTTTAELINQLLNSISLRIPTPPGEDVLHMQPARRLVLQFLHRLVEYYVIDNPRLATQQHGQREIIKVLFRIYHGAVHDRHSKNSNKELIPPRFREQLAELDTETDESAAARETRLAVDIVASFGDQDAIAMYRRLMGYAPGSVLDLIPG